MTTWEIMGWIVGIACVLMMTSALMIVKAFLDVFRKKRT